MNKQLMNYLESELMAFPHIDKRIKEVEQELLNPWQEQDENIGGGRSNNNVSQTEVKATRLVTDKRLAKLYEMKRAIQKVYDECNAVDKRLIDEYFFTKPRQLTMSGVAQKVCVSRATAYRMKRYIIHRLAEELGMG